MQVCLDNILEIDQKNLKDWSFLFSPENQDENINLEQFQMNLLPDEERQECAIKASRARRAIVERAINMENQLREAGYEDE